jgi:hypothetical protein
LENVRNPEEDTYFVKVKGKKNNVDSVGNPEEDVDLVILKVGKIMCKLLGTKKAIMVGLRVK